MLKEKNNFYLIAVFASILGILADYFFYRKTIGISFFIFVFAITAFSLAAAKRFEKKISKIQILILISAIILSAGVFLRASLFLNFFNIIGAIYLLLLFFFLFAEKNIVNFHFAKYILAPIELTAKSIVKAAKPINGYFRSLYGNKEIGSKEFRSVIKGLILSLPILLILGFLLYSADSVFRIYLDGLFQIKIDLISVSRILKIVIISYIFIGVFYKISDAEKIETPAEGAQKKRPLGFIESATVLVLVESLFLVFIAIQFFYLFGGKSYVWGIDKYITYSEYAKSGFYELILVSIVSFVLIYALDGFGKKETPKEKKMFKILIAALIFEITIILFSAFKRLLLYIDGYGLTLQRFLIAAFMLWVFLVFLAFAFKIIREYRNTVFIFSVFALTLATWLGINIANPDKLIAQINIERVAQGKKLDPYYLSSLSEDAVPEIVKIFKLNVNDEIKAKIAMDLNWRYSSADIRCGAIEYNPVLFSDPYISSQCKIVPLGETLKKFKKEKLWQSFNLAKEKALSAVEENSGEIEKYQLKYRGKQALICKENAAKCEADCNNNGWQSPSACKNSCGTKECDEFEQGLE